jgi:hypothetical protein
VEVIVEKIELDPLVPLAAEAIVPAPPAPMVIV